MPHQQNIIFGIIAILVFGILVVVIAGGGNQEVSDDEKLKFAATIFPLCDIARNVAGERADVFCILPPGASAHYFEFTPRGLQEMQGTEIIFAIGHGLDDWVQNVKNALPGTSVVIVDRNIALLPADEEHDADEEWRASDGGETSLDPHYWLHFGNAREIADTIGDSLAAADSAGAAVYIENSRLYKEALSLKERELKTRVDNAGVPVQGVITLHDAWYYFAENFGTEILATYEPRAGEGPTPRRLAGLEALVKEHGIRVLFSEPQSPNSAISVFADDLGLGIAELDPVGGAPGRESFIALMEYNVDSILNAADTSINE